MMKRENRGEVNELCQALSKVESALATRIAWTSHFLVPHIDRAKVPSYTGPAEIYVGLSQEVVLALLETEENRLRQALIRLGVEP